jgi:methenyltetrahydrofolate cyclohydrolase
MRDRARQRTLKMIMYAVRLDQSTLADLLAAIAAKSPTPGGGAVASITAALAAALGQMVLNYSIGKKALAQHEPLLRESLETLHRKADRALELAEADAKAYAALNELWKLDKSDARREREFPAALDAAIAAPRAVMDESLSMLRLLHSLTGWTNAMLNSDLAIAAILSEAAARAAAWNVRINLPLLANVADRSRLESEVASALGEAQSLTKKTEVACAASPSS